MVIDSHKKFSAQVMMQSGAFRYYIDLQSDLFLLLTSVNGIFKVSPYVTTPLLSIRNDWQWNDASYSDGIKTVYTILKLTWGLLTNDKMWQLQ